MSREIGIDLLNRALLSNLLPVQAARGLGLHALANSAQLRQAAMQLGLNGPGVPPPLMRSTIKT
jgi:2-octaprenyl-6-methoxyphenol hydroxylase